MDGDAGKAEIIRQLQTEAVAERDRIMSAARKAGFEEPLASATQLGSGRAPFKLPARIRRLAELTPGSAKTPEQASSNAGGSDGSE